MYSKLLIIIIFIIITENQFCQQISDIDSLVVEAVNISPKIKMLKAKKKIASSKIAQVSNLPDPQLTFGVNNLPTNSFSFTQEAMTSKIVGLSQTIPFPGKLASVEKSFSVDTLIVQKEIDDAANEIRENVTNLYFDISYIRESKRLHLLNKNLLLDIAKVVKAKYAVSTAKQQNLIKIELEITRINDDLEKIYSKEKSYLASLNSILYNKINSPIYTKALTKISPLAYTIEDLVEISENTRPYLEGIKLQKKKSFLKEEVSKYDYYPNINFRLQYSQRDYLASSNKSLSDLASFIIGINLPLNYGGKTSSKIKEAQLEQVYFDNQYEFAKQNLSITFSSLISELNELYEREKLTTEGLIPQATQSLKAALASYKVGDVDFINVIDAQSQLYKVEEMLYKIRRDFYKNVSRLEFLTGKKISLNDRG